MVERQFVGWHRPVLHAATDVLASRYGNERAWDLSRVLIVLPGRQAGRRLRQILQERAGENGRRLTLPDMITPADLPERLYAPPSRIAAPGEAFFAWLRAFRQLDEADRRDLAPNSDADGPLSGAGLAEQVAAARAEMMAEGLTLQDAARQCSALPGFCDDGRWPALACLERLYQDTLAQGGLADRDDARRAAPSLSCDQEIFLIGTSDLNGTERAMLRRLSSPVTVLIPAPPETQDGFDDLGVIQPDFWLGRPLPISDDCLHFVEDPAAEAFALADQVAALNGQFMPDEITLGVGDERAAEGLARRLAALGLPTASPFGRPLARARPAALLSAVRDYLQDPTARRFASLVRHPDLEGWLIQPSPCPLPSLGEGGSERGTSAEPGEGIPLLDTLDLYLAEHLPERLPDAGLPPLLAQARGAIEKLLAPLQASRPLPEWAEPLADILRGVYGSHELDEARAEDRQLRRGLAGIAAVLQDIRRLDPNLTPRLSGREALAYALGRLDGPCLPDDAHEGGIPMMGWLELALDDAPVLLLTGMHEGAVPAGGTAHPLLPDTLRRRLGLPDSRRRQARDAFLLRVLLESRPYVHLIAARRGVDGEPQRPSRLLFLCDGETAARRARRFAQETAAPPRPVFAPGAARPLPPPRPEPLPAPLTRLRVTAFRDYLACPYRFYLRHVLKLDERDDSADEMDARQFGLLLHACLAAFARAPVAEAPDADPIARFLRSELGRQARAQFGGDLPPQLRLQVRQAGRRLDAFARWQAQQTAQGWLIQDDLSERDLEAEMMVDGQPFTLTGRLDRVDYHPGEDRYRIVDYKTGDSGQGPEAKHRGAADGDGQRPWTDLQLPLYRTLAGANGVAEDRLEVGYVLLAADLSLVPLNPKGGLGYVPARWSEEEFRERPCLRPGCHPRPARRDVLAARRAAALRRCPQPPLPGHLPRPRRLVGHRSPPPPPIMGEPEQNKPVLFRLPIIGAGGPTDWMPHEHAYQRLRRVRQDPRPDDGLPAPAARRPPA